MLVEALVAELAVEALDVAVLHRATGLDQEVLDAMVVCPCNEDPAGELGAVVGPDRPRITAEAGGLVQHAHDVGAADAVVHGDVDALVGEVVGHRQGLQAAPAGQCVADEIHAPYRIGCAGR